MTTSSTTTACPSLKGFDALEVAPTEDQPLYHLSINPNASETVLLLHGLTSSSREWLDIAPYLAAEYHLLVPDLPAHSRSRAIQPFSLSTTAEHLAGLIRASARGGVCHLVGFSAGGYAALALAENHPELLRDVFVSGVYDMAKSPNGALVKFAPYVDVPLTKLMGSLPTSVFGFLIGRVGLKYPDGLREDTSANSSMKLVQDGFQAILDFGAGRPVAVRTCLIAASKHDDVPGTQALCRVLKDGGGNQSSRAFVLKDMMHPWGRQNPQLFADAVKSWIQGKDLPAEFESLE